MNMLFLFHALLALWLVLATVKGLNLTVARLSNKPQGVVFYPWLALVFLAGFSEGVLDIASDCINLAQSLSEAIDELSTEIETSPLSTLPAPRPLTK